MKKNALTLFCFFALFFTFYAQGNDSLDDYLDMAAVFKESFEYDKAESVLEKAILDNGEPKARSFLARIKFLNAEPEKALRLFKSVKNKSWLDYFYLGLIYEDLGNNKSAILNYKKSLDHKTSSITFFRLGRINLKNKDYNKAAKYFRDTIKLDPSFRIAYYYLGLSLWEVDNFKQAYRYLSKAINFYPKNKKVLRSLNLVKADLGEDFFINRKKAKETKRKSIRPKSYLPKDGLPVVRVGLAKNVRQFSFSCGSEFKIVGIKTEFNGQANKLYTIILSDAEIFLRDYHRQENIEIFTSDIRIEATPTKQGRKFAFYILDVSYGVGHFWHKKIDRVYRGDFEAIKTTEGLTLVNILSIEEYLYGVLPAEISYRVGKAAQEAQAVAARTIAYRGMGRHKKDGYDFCADVHCQVYQGMSVERPKANRAVDNTKGKVLFYKDRPIEALYHSTCGGCLRSDAFGKREYLVEKLDSKDNDFFTEAYLQEEWFLEGEDTFCSDAKGKFRWQRIYDREDFEFVFGYDLSEIKNILFKEKGECFHYNKIDIIRKDRKEVLNGDLGIRNYFDKLRSSAFKVDIQYSKDKVPKRLFFWGAGFGHGAGLCQEGAISMAEKGFEYEDILKHYYPAATIQQAY